MNQSIALLGALNYEFRMQIRRRAVWITLILLMCLLLALFFRQLATIQIILGSNPLFHLSDYPLIDSLVQWGYAGNRLLPIGVGVLLADRLVRDRRTRVDELLTTLPASLGGRLLGKYLGSMLATLVPVFAFYTLGVIFILVQTHNLLVLPLSLLVFAALTLPGMLFVSAFSVALPILIWVPLYQFLFVGYYFWGNELGTHTGIPTLSGTILTPIGGFMARGLFGIQVSELTITASQGAASILTLVGLSALVMFALCFYTRWQQSRL